MGFDLVPLNDSLRKFTVCFKNSAATQWVLETERVHAVGAVGAAALLFLSLSFLGWEMGVS